MEMYRLDGHVAVPCSEAEYHQAWIERRRGTEAGVDPWRVAATDVSDDCRVSTVFLGLDHNWFGSGEPLLFETMVFGGDRDGYCDRWSTWEQAIAAHDQIVARLRAHV